MKSGGLLTFGWRDKHIGVTDTQGDVEETGIMNNENLRGGNFGNLGVIAQSVDGMSHLCLFSTLKTGIHSILFPYQFYRDDCRLQCLRSIR